MINSAPEEYNAFFWNGSREEYDMFFDNEDAIYESSALHPLEVPDGYWRSVDGDIEISKMTDAHLRNAIAYAERKGFGDTFIVNQLRLELSRR